MAVEGRLATAVVEGLGVSNRGAEVDTTTGTTGNEVEVNTSGARMVGAADALLMGVTVGDEPRRSRRA